MLQFMRQRASSWMIKVILSIIVLAFVFMGVGNFRDREATVAARVNGEVVAAAAFQNRYYQLLERVRQQFGNNLSDDMLDMLNLKEQAMEQLIGEKLIIQQAHEYGLRVTDAELARSIREISAFQRNGRFDQSLYNRVLQQNRLMPEAFEQRQRRQLLVDKMHAIITGSVKMSAEEARRWYDWQNTRIKINYVLFPPDQYAGTSPAAEDLAAHYREHQEDYQSPARVKISYLAFTPAQYTDQVTVSDDEIQAYYQENRQEYAREKTVQARHILIRVAAEASEDQVAAKREQAAEVYGKIKAGLDFAAAARQYSEGPSAADGGQLGAFKKEDMVAPFAEKAFSMEAGQVSQPVRTRFGWHLIKVEKVNPAADTPLAEVKEEIRQNIARDRARDLAYEAAVSAFDIALEENSLKAAASFEDREAVTTPFFSSQEKIAGIPGSGRLVQEAFTLSVGDISDVLEIEGDWYLFQVAERQAPQVPPLEEIRARVAVDFQQQMQEEKAAAAAEAFLSDLQNKAQTMAQAADQAGLTMNTTDFFGRGESIPSIGRVPSLAESAFALTPEEPVADSVLAGKGGYYVIALADRRLPDAAEFAENRDQAEQGLLQRKKDRAFSQWLDVMRGRSEIMVEERFLE